MHHVDDANVEILLKGPPLSEGPKPAIFYFAIGAHDSLSLDPFSQPVEALSGEDVRIFSITLPYHEQGLDPYKAIELWAKNIDVLVKFLDDATSAIKRLLAENILIAGKIGLMGLSRGGLIAMHLAARIKEISAICGFAPVTRLSVLSEFESGFADKYEPKHLIESLCHRKIRFYIGNRDTRVCTRSCFEWIEAACEKSDSSSPSIELIISPSIGRNGHGTPKENFEAGARWLRNIL